MITKHYGAVLVTGTAITSQGSEHPLLPRKEAVLRILRVLLSSGLGQAAGAGADARPSSTLPPYSVHTVLLMPVACPHPPGLLKSCLPSGPPSFREHSAFHHASSSLCPHWTVGF